DTDRVAPQIAGAGVAASVAEVSRHGPHRAGFERPSEHVERRAPPMFAGHVQGHGCFLNPGDPTNPLPYRGDSIRRNPVIEGRPDQSPWISSRSLFVKVASRMFPGTSSGAHLDELAKAAVAHLAAGRFAEAESLCRAVLAENPNELRALHSLGLVALAAGRAD